MIDRAALRFVLVGGTVYLFDTAMLWALVRLAGFGLAAGTTAAYVAGVLLHFVLSCTFTFADTQASWRRRIGGYLGVLALNYLITLGIVVGMQTYVVDNVVLSKTTAVATTAVTGYLGLRRLAFPQQK